MRPISAIVVVLALGGCGARSAPLSDSALTADTRRSEASDGFCQGSPRTALNGAEVPVVEVEGSGFPEASCCNDLGLVAFRLPDQGEARRYLKLTIFVFVGAKVDPAMSIDAAHLPSGWSLLLEYYLCKDATTGVCVRAAGLVDALSTEDKDLFEGTLTYSGPEDERRLTLCLSSVSGVKPHPFLQQARLYAPSVPIPKWRL